MKQELGKMMVMESIQRTQLVEPKKSNVGLILMLVLIGLGLRATQGQMPASTTASSGTEQERWMDHTRDDEGVQDRTRPPEPEYYTVLDPQ